MRRSPLGFALLPRTLALVLVLAGCGDPGSPEIDRARTHLPVQVGNNVRFESLAASIGHTCGLTTTGETFCWGGLSEPFLLLPTPVADTARFVQVTAHCGLRATGEVRCWDFPALQPYPVPGASRFTMVSSGPAISCGLTMEGAVHCWSHMERGAPQPVSDLPPLTTMDVGRFVFTICGLAADGSAHCVGPAGRLEVADGGRPFSALSNGGMHRCGVSAGTGFCWGFNDWGQLGTGSTAFQPAPEPIHGQQPFVTLAAGAEHTCALTSAGVPWCWGLNLSSQLGSIGAETCTNQVPWVGVVTEPCSRSPRAVQTDLRFASLSSGSMHTCALTASGQAYCWGARSLLGDGRR
jgi:hypothetical protein